MVPWGPDLGGGGGMMMGGTAPTSDYDPADIAAKTSGSIRPKRPVCIKQTKKKGQPLKCFKARKSGGFADLKELTKGATTATAATTSSIKTKKRKNGGILTKDDKNEMKKTVKEIDDEKVKKREPKTNEKALENFKKMEIKAKAPDRGVNSGYSLRPRKAITKNKNNIYGGKKGR